VGGGSFGIEIQFSSKSSEYLYNKWIHSYEEDALDSVNVFRREGFDFPPGRFRQAYQFFKNGDFYEYSLDSVDRPVTYKGKWIYDSKEKVIEIIFSKLEIVKDDIPLPQTTLTREGYFFVIYSLEPDKLRLRKVK
jgi:hypothetical protein